MVSTEQSPARRRWLVGGLVAVGVVLAAAWFVRSVVFRDRARAVSTEEAVDEFRTATTTTTAATTPTAVSPPTPETPETPEVTDVTTTVPITPTTPSPTSSTPAPPSTPEPGVYRYRTTGGEDIDTFGGTSHTYPDETTITVVEAGCGVELRWEALLERREEWELCPTPDGVELQPDGVQYHEFYSWPEEELVACDRPVLVVPTEAALPEPVTQSCMLANDPWLPVWEVLEMTTRVVEGEVLDVRHVRMTIVDEDEYWEQTIIDWHLLADGLPVEVTSSKSSVSPSVVGPVAYNEQYHLLLLSTEPLR